ncbi:MAG: OmpA family protein [Gammaproteobacteria bacterium]|nr:OmpA family protein [Gammaproteobacteria bacterium]
MNTKNLHMRARSRFGFLVPMLGLSMVAVSAVAQASDQSFDTRWYVTPQYSYVWPDSNENTNSGSGWQFNLGKPITENWDLELGVIDYSLDAKSGLTGSFRQTAYGVNGLWFFYDRPKVFSPFLLVGAGANDQSPSGMVPVGNSGSSTNAYGTIGVGFLTAPWEWGGAIRVSVQDLSTFGNGSYNDMIASVGLQIPLGSTESEVSAEPASEPTPEPPPVTAPAEVAPPEPPPEAPVAAPQKVIELPGVKFALNSDRLLSASEATLDHAVRLLEDNPNIDAEVAGYTDSTGKAAYNLKLSQRRAEAVMKYLVDHGIDASRLTAKGYGEADPIATNRTRAGRSENRRVELRVTNP